jgi:dTDP-3-amino-3,4,6-trideoxy-alpha-D-glucose transaminase
MKIPFFDSERSLSQIHAELHAALDRVVDSKQLILGPEVTQFESEFAELLGLDPALSVSCNSGTDALVLALKTWGIGPGDEVIVPAMTALPTATAVIQAGARPVFADIDPDTSLLSPASVSKALTPQVKAIIPVHLYGNGAPIAELQKLAGSQVRILEDVAQAAGTRIQGRPAGTLGDAGAFSFYPTKNLGALGDGGLVVFRNAKEAQKARSLRYYGQGSRYELANWGGWNTRLDELQAAFLRIRLKRFSADNSERGRCMNLYREQLKGIPARFYIAKNGVEPAWHLAVLRLDDPRSRDPLRQHLEKAGIQALIHYPIPCHLQAPFRELRRVDCSESDKAAQSILSLPLFPGLTEKEVSTVSAEIRRFFGK